MVPTAWVKHEATDQCAEVPADAVPTLVQSGWERMSDYEVADLTKTADEKLAEVEAEMRAKAAAGAFNPEESSDKTDKTAGKRPAKSSTSKGDA